MCSHAHQSLFQLPPSTWCAAVAVPQRKPSGNERVVIRGTVPANMTPCWQTGEPSALDDSIDLLDLEAIEVNIFRGHSARRRSRQRVFGGQVAGQALVAAARTVDRPDDGPRPLAARVLPAPGRPDACRSSTRSTASATAESFTTRRVVAHPARQGDLQPAGLLPRPRGRPRPPGPDARRTSPHPRRCPTSRPRMAPYKDALGDWYDRPRPIDMRYVDGRARSTASDRLPPHQRVWLRADGRLPDDPVLHACIVTYASRHDPARHDAAAPRRALGRRAACMMASLDHAMWFHRPVPGRRVAAVRPGHAVGVGRTRPRRGSIFTHDGAPGGDRRARGPDPGRT